MNSLERSIYASRISISPSLNARAKGKWVMAMSARKLHPEIIVEDPITALDYIRSNQSEMKTDIRELRQDGKRLDTKIDALAERLDAKFERLEAKIDKSDATHTARWETVAHEIKTLNVNMEQFMSKLTRWGIALYIGMGTGILRVVARASPPAVVEWC